MSIWICKECGAHVETDLSQPGACLICEDDRQFVPPSGQEWLAREGLSAYANDWHELEPGLISIGVTPTIGIGQQALLVLTPRGNILWDCVSLLDADTKDRIAALGGLRAIAVSHPHFYTGMAEWSAAFGDIPIFISALDQSFVTRSSKNIHQVEDDQYEILPGVIMHRFGGHFPGSSILEWQAGAEDRGAILTGDTIHPTAGNRHVSFMYSFPNILPLPAREVVSISERVERLSFDRLYGGWRGKIIAENAKAIVLDSAKRYVEAVA